MPVLGKQYFTIREYIAGMGPADIDALWQTVSRGLDAAAIQKLSDSNREVARTGHVPFLGPIPGM